MRRELDQATLDQAGSTYAAWFLADRPPFDRAYVLEQFHRFTFKDEFTYMIDAVRRKLGAEPLADFDAALDKLTREKPRDDAVFHRLLAEKLAITPEGAHIAGKIGTTDLGARVVGKRVSRGGRVRNLYWPVYAGEGEERIAGSGVADPLPPGTEPLPVGALNTRMSNECAALACDAVVDNLDEGTGAAVIQGRSGAQPADPDTAVTGTLLFTLVCSDPAFGGAVDDTGKATATAGAITADASADATATLGYCRASSTNDGATPLDDHIDGEAGVAGADYNFNTLAIVAGANVAMSAWQVSMPEG